MWLLYEQPDTNFEDVAARFLDIHKRIYNLPELGNKAVLVAIPTTSGTGSEVTPFTVITDDDGTKHPLADYAFMPNMAIIDSQLTANMPKALTAFGGVDAVTHALESIVSIVANDFTTPHAMNAIKLLFKYLPSAYTNGAKDPIAREKVHAASTMAGMAFANAFLGITHSLAHALGGKWHVPHGLANALLLSVVVEFNAVADPFRMGTFSQYGAPQAIERYAEVFDMLEGNNDLTDTEKVIGLVSKIEDLKASVGIPKTLREALGDTVTEEAFLASVEEMAETAFNDQCTGCNPRQPLIADLRALYLLAYYGS
jgi:acetaldehyde dehydrogenase/alcohol dehydrogenase